ncbi:MAG: cyclodeaminase/cyclohydrolase family protein [Planctomycetota bacterium]|nr:cyclodeaminase/cyclohydrolase family protein [Planctomycetota bacterium]
MTHTVSLVDLPLRDFVASLAARTPTPGGGSMAAALVASGSALAAMACRFTSGEKFAAVEGAMARRVEGLAAHQARGLALVDLDARSYDAVTAAYKLPKSSDPEKALRTAAIQAGLRGALEVPAETIEHALAALALAVDALPDVNSNLVSDIASGANCLASACEAAFLNVKINAGSIADKAWGQERLARAERQRDEARQLLARANEIVARRLAG